MTRRRFVVAVVVVIGVFATVAAVYAFLAVRDLRAAQGSIAVDSGDVDVADLMEGRGHLMSAARRLDALPLRVAGLIPGVGHNLRAGREVAGAGVPVIDAALDLEERLDGSLAGGFGDGRIDPAVLEDLEEPLARQEEALRDLERVAAGARNGWLIPPVWDQLDEIESRAGSLAEGAVNARELVERAPDLLGASEPRTYLVMSLNNAELRGAGGLLSGIGTLTMDGGRIRVGPQFPREQLVREPYRDVPAPPDYLERYGNFEANTTLWANVSYSPDVVDDAMVGSRLFELVTGSETHGALVIDPRGLEAVLPEDAEVAVPGGDRTLEAEEIAPWIFSEAYAEFDDQFERRAAILAVGKRALEEALDDGLDDVASIQRAGEAMAAGHLRFISYQPDELRALNALGTTGDVGGATGDFGFVAAHNFGDGRGEGTKLDYWADRSVRHACQIVDDGAAACSLQATIRNETPEGLTRYVAGQPYGLLRTYAELLIPGHSTIHGVYLDGESTEFRSFEEERLTSLTIYTEIERGDDSTITVEYSLPPDEEGYSLELVPQPLARDAELELHLRVPTRWTVEGPYERDGSLYSYEGEFDRTIEARATPSGKTGIPRAWETVTTFWNEPLF